MFKKVWIALLFILSGCFQQPRDVQFERALIIYESHYFSILDNDRFLSSSNHFTLTLETYQLGDVFRYDLIIDDPQVAMYEVVVVIVEDNQNFETLTALSPSIGVFDSTVNLVPNQVNVERGFPRGILLSGISTNSTRQLKVMVAWKDYYKLNQYREYFIIDIDFLAEPIDEVPHDDEDVNEDE